MHHDTRMSGARTLALQTGAAAEVSSLLANNPISPALSRNRLCRPANDIDSEIMSEEMACPPEWFRWAIFAGWLVSSLLLGAIGGAFPPSGASM